VTEPSLPELGPSGTGCMSSSARSVISAAGRWARTTVS